MAQLYIQVWENSHKEKLDSPEEVDHLYDCLSETALEYASSCEGRDDHMQTRAELSRFDRQDMPLALGRNC